jgi:hypothetical protein
MTGDGTSTGPPPFSPFRVPAAVVASSRGPRVLKHGDCFAVLDALGNAQADGPAAEGLFFEDTRYLSRLRIAVGGLRPVLLSSSVVEENDTLSVDLANPDLFDGPHLRLPRASLHILCKIVLDEGPICDNVAVSVVRRDGPVEIVLTP